MKPGSNISFIPATTLMVLPMTEREGLSDSSDFEFTGHPLCSLYCSKKKCCKKYKKEGKKKCKNCPKKK